MQLSYYILIHSIKHYKINIFTYIAFINSSKLHIRFKSYMFWIMTPLFFKLFRRPKIIYISYVFPNKFAIFILSTIKLKELQGHKVVVFIRLESFMFSIISMKSMKIFKKENKCFEFRDWNRINCLSHRCARNQN